MQNNQLTDFLQNYGSNDFQEDRTKVNCFLTQWLTQLLRETIADNPWANPCQTRLTTHTVSE